MNAKVLWNGHTDSFLPFKKAIEGHLLTVRAAYILDPYFLSRYSENPQKYHFPETYDESDDVWFYYKQSCHQIRDDAQYLYGILMMSCRNIDNKIIIRHDRDKDGILAWMEMKENYDYHGSKTLRMENLMEIIYKDFQNNMTGGLGHT